MSDRNGEPPALPNGAVEVLRWQDARGNWTACDDKGGEWLWFEEPSPGRWERCAGTSDAARRLAAELAACRARRDEGDGSVIDHDEAYGLWCAAPESSTEERRAVHATERRAEIAMLRARLIHLEAIDRLLGRGATTATPAGEGER